MNLAISRCRVFACKRELAVYMFWMTSPLTPALRALAKRFSHQRDHADRALAELDNTARELACALLAHGLTLREAAPFMSRADVPFSHAQVGHAARGGRSRRPWAGFRARKAGARG